MEKVEKDGKVAVLVSGGFGAGWSTWGDEDSEKKLFCPEIVNALLNNESKQVIQEIADKLFTSYNGGIDGLRVEWVDKGVAFRVTEYDGSEELEIIGELDHYIA